MSIFFCCCSVVSYYYSSKMQLMAYIIEKIRISYLRSDSSRSYAIHKYSDIYYSYLDKVKLSTLFFFFRDTTLFVREKKTKNLNLINLKK